MSVLHRAEARKRVEELLRSLAARPEIERSAVVEDVLGTFGLVIWTTSPPTPEFEASLSGAIDPLAPYLTMADLVLVPPGGDGDSTVRDLHEATWQALAHALGQLEHVVALVDVLGDRDQVLE